MINTQLGFYLRYGQMTGAGQGRDDKGHDGYQIS